MKPYKAKTLIGAERLVRKLKNEIKARDHLLTSFEYDMRQVAKLASETPQFHNPLMVQEAKKKRDQIIFRESSGIDFNSFLIS